MVNNPQDTMQSIDTQKMLYDSYCQGFNLFLMQMEMMVIPLIGMAFWLPDQEKQSVKSIVKSTRAFYNNLRSMTDHGFSSMNTYYSGAQLFNQAFTGPAGLIGGFGSLANLLSNPLSILGRSQNQREESVEQVS